MLIQEHVFNNSTTIDNEKQYGNIWIALQMIKIFFFFKRMAYLHL